jgi:hypothetical protein
MTQPPVSCFLADFLFVEPMVDVQFSSGILHRVKAGGKQNVTREGNWWTHLTSTQISKGSRDNQVNRVINFLKVAPRG